MFLMFQESSAVQRGELDDITNEVARLRVNLRHLESECRSLTDSINSKTKSLPWFDPRKKVNLCSNF